MEFNLFIRSVLIGLSKSGEFPLVNRLCFSQDYTKTLRFVSSRDFRIVVYFKSSYNRKKIEQTKVFFSLLW